MRLVMCVAGLGAIALLGACENAQIRVTTPQTTRVVAATDIEAGRYLVQITGCNDCHSPRGAPGSPPLDEADTLRGNGVGFYGPWGTTYAANLRLTTATLTEEAWVDMLSTREGRPIMPWASVRAMDDADKRAIYRYIRSLPGEPGEAVPDGLPPGQVPSTPYEDLNIKMPAGALPPR